MKKIITIIFSILSIFVVTVLGIIINKILFPNEIKKTETVTIKNPQIKRIQAKLKKKFKKENFFFIVPNSNFSSNYLNDFLKYISKNTNNVKNIVFISPLNKETKDFYLSFNKTGNYCIGTPFKNPIPNCFYGKNFDFYSGKNSFIFFKTTNTYFSGNFKNNIYYFLLKKYIGKNLNFYDIKIKKIGNQEELKNLAKKLKNYNFDSGNTIYFAIGDFSKFKIDKIAVFKDLKTINVLNSNKNENIETECPNCLFLIKEIARQQQKPAFNIYNREISNIKNLLTKKSGRNSHIYGEFKRVLKDDNYRKKAFLSSYQETSFENSFKIFDNNKDNSKKIYGAFFGDTHFTRGFTYKDSLKRKENFFKCFYEDYDTKKDLKKYFHRMFYGLDFIGVNLETSVALENECGIFNKPIKFRTLPEYLKDFKKVGINLFNLANNHSIDCGQKGVIATKKHLQENNLDFFGDPTNSKNSILKKEINGLKVAFLGFNTIGTHFDVDEAEENIKKLKAKGYLVIINIHWGEEYVTKITNLQKQLAKRFVDAGANLIIGHHPHVVQNYEIYKGVPIFYSLGNFIFDQHFKITLKGRGIFYELSPSGVKFNIIDFKRNPLNWEIDCNSIDNVGN